MTRDASKPGRGKPGRMEEGRGKQVQGGFASRWAQRKRAAQTGAAPDAPPEGMPPAAAPAEDARPDAEILAELGLPDPDTLAPDDDFSAFMAKAVPARLRHRALRRLWLSDPVYANLDLLVEYGEDYTDAATVIPDMKTLYKVGKGFVDRTPPAEEGAAPDAAQAPAEPAPAEGDPTEDVAAPDAPAVAPGAAPAESVAAHDAAAGQSGAPADPEKRPSALTIAPRRRMRFRLAED